MTVLPGVAVDTEVFLVPGFDVEGGKHRLLVFVQQEKDGPRVIKVEGTEFF